MPRYAITRKEAKIRTGYILLGFFGVYLVSPVQEWVDSNLHINPIVLGIAGILLTLYFFEF